MPSDAAYDVTNRGVLAVLVPLGYDVYFGGILAGVVEAAYEQGLRLSIATTRHEHAREAAVLEDLLDSTEGAVIILPEQSSDELERARDDGYPLAVVDPLLPLGDGVPSVAVANQSGAEQAIDHLVALGHRRIGVVSGPPGWVATEGRRGGWRAAFARAGIPEDPVLVADADFEIGPGEAAAVQLLDLADPPTALFCCNDAMAIGAMRAARERDLRVPEDVSIVGFDDLPYATIVMPALTTIRQPLAEMGRAGVGLVLRQLASRNAEAPHIELPTRLIVRESTAPARHAT
jgi:LacI family transcriptional regulator